MVAIFVVVDPAARIFSGNPVVISVESIVAEVIYNIYAGHRRVSDFFGSKQTVAIVCESLDYTLVAPCNFHSGIFRTIKIEDGLNHGVTVIVFRSHDIALGVAFIMNGRV